ncbi:MAG TPA: FliA/WhiG family RNA polymerase sigma factor [Bryobacteraceae bacterium]|nr:FliA/WhiG family RNA polymerase sigma factor [Bryobacteraceae bacterium]
MTGSAVKQAFDPPPATLCTDYGPMAPSIGSLKSSTDKAARAPQAAICGHSTKHARRVAPIQTPATRQAPALRDDYTRRDQLILEHLSLVHAIAFHIQRALPIHIEIDDLKHAGMMGLFDAASKYEPAKEIAFRSYAKHRIRGAILDSLRDLDWASRDLRRRHRQVELLKRSLTEKLDREPTTPELAEAIGIDMRRFRAMLVDFRSVSLAAARLKSAREGDGGVHTEAPCAPDTLPDRLFAQVEMRDRINDAMQALPCRYRKVVFLYYTRELTMREIGVILGVNESRVSQMHRCALTKMQTFLEQSGIASTGVF